MDLTQDHFRYLADCEIANREVYQMGLKPPQGLRQSLQGLVGLSERGFESVELEVKKSDEPAAQGGLDTSIPFACEITQIESRKVEQPKGGGEEELSIGNLGIPDTIPTKIEAFLWGVYLGTERVARNFQVLSEKKIKLIINCAPEVCRNWFINDIDYKWIFMPDPALPPDSDASYLQCLVYELANTLVKYVSEEFSVMFHCADYAGDSHGGARSVALLVGVMMVSLSVTFDDAVSIILKKWEVSLPQHLEAELRALESRRKNPPKSERLFAIDSYSPKAP